MLVGKSARNELIATPVDLSSTKILLIDGHGLSNKMLADQLTQWGAQVLEVCSGADAILEASKGKHFDLTFMDLAMDNNSGCGGGLRFGKELHKNYPGTKQILMMPSCIQVSSAALVDNGFELALSKPITIKGLSGTLCQLFPLTAPTDTENDSSTEMFPATTRILLVDDDQINHLVGESILELFGLTADFAFNGQEALEKLRISLDSSPYAIVLMDCEMPVMNGYDTSRAIRSGKAGESYKNIPIIALTGSTMEGDREKCIEAGITDYLSKPVQEDALLKKLKEVMGV